MGQQPTSLLIRNARIARRPWDSRIEQGDILIEDGRIQAIGQQLIPSAKQTAEIDASGLVAIPGFIQTHIHLCQTLFRHLANGYELLPWLERRIWPLEAAHNEASLRTAVRLGLAELIASGTTTILDMGATHGVEVIVDQFARIGYRGNIGVTIMNSPPSAPEALRRPVRKSIDYFLSLRKEYSSSTLVDFHLAPRFGLAVSAEDLRTIGEVARAENCLIHTHASENRQETQQIRKRQGMGNIEWYHQVGITGEHLCLAHCIWVDPEERMILRETHTRVLHCPTSNLKLGSGIAPVPEYLADGILCSLAADGAPCNNNLNIFQEMKLAALIQAVSRGVEAISPGQIVRMATIDAARTLHMEQQIGSLEVGKQADIVLLDLDLPHTLPEGDLASTLVYAAGPENVHTVMIGGRIVLQERRLIAFERTELAETARIELKHLLKRAKL